MKNSNPAATRVLVADDQPDVREALRLLLKNEGYEIQPAASPAEILTALEAREFDIVLMDLNYARDTTSGAEGLDLLMRIQAIDSALPVIVMTAWGSVQLAVEAMRRGARALHSETVGERAAAGDCAHAGRAAAITAPSNPTGSGKQTSSRGFHADAYR